MPAAERARRARRHDQVAVAAGQPCSRPIDHHPPAGAFDLVAEAVVQPLPALARVAEQLVPRLAALDLAPDGQLAPQPRHRDVVGVAPELLVQQRTPDLLPSLRAHHALHPLARGHVVERRDVAVPTPNPEHRRAHAQPRR